MTREDQLACLEDRPCAVCKFHTDGCSRWTCVFEEEPEEQQPCEDAISKEAVITKIEDEDRLGFMGAFCCHDCAMSFRETIKELPSVKPKYTDEEIQKMQELEQAQLEKAYELGKTESFEDWLSSFNTDSATKCFTAVQELKKRLEGEE